MKGLIKSEVLIKKLKSDLDILLRSFKRGLDEILLESEQKKSSSIEKSEKESGVILIPERATMISKKWAPKNPWILEKCLGPNKSGRDLENEVDEKYKSSIGILKSFINQRNQLD